MKYHAILKKMKTTLAEVVLYQLDTKEGNLLMNENLGKPIKISFTGKIFCLACGKPTKKSFAQGYCYSCFANSPETEECVLRPELCRAHVGIARDMNYATEHCLQTHIVYLALSSDIKVGITRGTQVPTRWIDQGAWKAIRLAETPNRYTAGMIEVFLKNHLPDKTNWRKMLKNENADLDLLERKKLVSSLLSSEYQQFVSPNNEIVVINFPVLKYPIKINSLDFEKQPEISGTLGGIKGQYLLFDDGNVVNIRKFGGYEVEIDL